MEEWVARTVPYEQRSTWLRQAIHLKSQGSLKWIAVGRVCQYTGNFWASARQMIGVSKGCSCVSRANGMTITLFVAPQALLMQLPFIGPLVYVPMQFSAAWLLDRLLREQPATGEVAVPDHMPYASHHAPTKPPPMHPVQEPPSSAAQYQQHFPPVQYHPPLVQASAPPLPGGSGQGNVQPWRREGYPAT